MARLHIILLPDSSAPSTEAVRNHRLIVMARKYIPDASKHEVIYGQVIHTGNDLSKLRDSLGPRSYDTKTRGERHIAAARVAGRGRYVIRSPSDNMDDASRGTKDQSAIFKTFLAYVISALHDMGEVQEELKIKHEGAFYIQVRDPKSKSTNPRVRT